MKKVIKAHEGMAHVPKPSNQQAPSKAKGTAGTTPRTPKRRMIGLPQRFRGAGKELLSGRRRAPTPPSYLSTPMKPSDGQQQATSGLKKITSKDIKSQLTPKQIKAQRDDFKPRRATAPAPQAPPRVKPTKAMREPAVIQQPKPVVRPPKQSDAGDGRGGIPVFELPNKGRGKNIRRPKPQIRRAQAPRTPMVGKPIPRIMNQGGYISRAKYGQVDNLKKGK